MRKLTLAVLITVPVAAIAADLPSSEWSKGALYRNTKEFTHYINKTALEYNNPVQSSFVRKQEKEN